MKRIQKRDRRSLRILAALVIGALLVPVEASWAAPLAPGAVVGVVAQSAVGQIVFTSFRDGNIEIYVMNADGSGQTRLTTNGAERRFSRRGHPTGRQIVFTRVARRQLRDLRDERRRHRPDPAHTNNAASTTAARVVARRHEASPSPSTGTATDEIYVMNADGTGQTRLTNNAAHRRRSRVVARRHEDRLRHRTRDGNYEIYVMNADGTGQTRLTNNPAADDCAGVVARRAKIAFTSTRDGNFEIYRDERRRHRPDRLTDQHRGLTTTPAVLARRARRSPSTATRDGNAEIYRDERRRHRPDQARHQSRRRLPTFMGRGGDVSSGRWRRSWAPRATTC